MFQEIFYISSVECWIWLFKLFGKIIIVGIRVVGILIKFELFSIKLLKFKKF